MARFYSGNLCTTSAGDQTDAGLSNSTRSLSIGLGQIFHLCQLLGKGQPNVNFRPRPGPAFRGTGMELNGKGTTAGLNASVLYTSGARPKDNLTSPSPVFMAQPAYL